MTGMASTCSLAIDAGGTFFKSALVCGPRVVPGSNVALDSAGSCDEILQAYERVIRANLQKAGTLGWRVAGIGVATPGPFDYKTSTSRMRHKFPGIYGKSLIELVHGCIPETARLPMYFIHDVHAFLLGEYQAGAAAGFSNVAAVTIGTGLGFGCIVDGRIRDNGNGGPCVSLYGRPYQRGILEDVVSRRGIIRLYGHYAKQAVPQGVDVVDIAQRASIEHDQAACQAFRDVGTALAENLIVPLADMGIECLVIGGQIAKAYRILEETIRAGLRDVRSLRKISVGSNIDTAALIGVAHYVAAQSPTSGPPGELQATPATAQEDPVQEDAADTP